MVDTMTVLLSVHLKNEYVLNIVCEPPAGMGGTPVVGTPSVQIVGLQVPTFDVGEHMTIDDEMRPAQFSRRNTPPAGNVSWYIPVAYTHHPLKG